jgi:hypothetical protein
MHGSSSNSSNSHHRRRVWVDLEPEPASASAAAAAASASASTGGWSGVAGEAPGGGGGRAFSSTALREIAEVAERSEGGHRVVMEALDALRQVGAAGQHEVAGVRVSLLRDDSTETAGGGGAGAADPASAASRARAFVTRLEVLTEVRHALGVSSAAAVRRAAALLRSSSELVAQEQGRYPQLVSAASGRVLNETKQVLQRGAEEVREASQHTEQAVAARLAARDAEVRAVGAEATGAVLRLRDRLMRSDAMRRLAESAAAGRSGAPRAFGEPDHVAALPGHLAALSSAASVEVVRREAECALLAFDHAVTGGRLGASSHGGSSPGQVPQELLDQITNAERRREFATMPEARAAALLQQTRETLRNAQHLPDTARRLRVVEQILEIRSSGGGGGGDGGVQLSAWGSEQPHTIEVRRGLSRLAETASLAARIVREKESESARRVEEMRAALHKVAGEMAARTSAAAEGHLGRWKQDLEAAYARSQAAVLGRAQDLADVVVGALELCVADAGPAAEEDEDAAGPGDLPAEPEFGSVSAWRSHRTMRTDLFAPEAEAEAEAEAQAAGSAAPPVRPQKDGFSAHPSHELRRAHALVLDGFLAWVAYARAVLTSNAKGTQRAAAAIRASLGRPRAEFNALVAAAQRKPSAGGLGAAA